LKRPNRPVIPAKQEPTYSDVVYAEAHKSSGKLMELKMDIFQPEKILRPTPVIIYLYGGAWERGNYKQTVNTNVYYRDLVRLTEIGFTVVSPSYRLSHESIFPACIHDVKGVVRFLRANKNKYSINAEKIGVFGNSAGGHLAGLLATSYEIPKLEGDTGGNLSYSSKIQAAVIYYGPTDILEMSNDQSEFVQSKEEAKKIHDNYMSPESKLIGLDKTGKGMDYLRQVRDNNDTNSPFWKYVKLAELANPSTHVRKDSPPIMIFHGSLDPVVPFKQSIRLYNALKRKGVEAYFIGNSLGSHGPSLGNDCDRTAINFLIDRLK